MNDLESPYFSECPRCGGHSLEHLESFAHCANCFYSHDMEVMGRPTNLVEIESLLKSLEEQEQSDEVTTEAELPKAVGW